MLQASFHGFILALGLILPLGVQNLFVFNQGVLHKRFISTLPVVITAALCDSLLISLAVIGVSVVIFGVYWIKTLLLSVGLLFLLYMGLVTWHSKPSNGKEGSETTFSIKKQIGFAASVSLLNPHAIMDTIGVIGTSSILYEGPQKIMFALTCIVVSWLWFIGLALAGKYMGKLDKAGRYITTFNKISALSMWGVGVYIATLLFLGERASI